MRIPQTIDRLRRLSDISLILAKHGLGELNPGGGAVLRLFKGEKAQTIFGRRLSLVLEDLGPTFVKLGQLMSTRYDLFSPEMIDELEKLQDTVNPLPFDEIK